MTAWSLIFIWKINLKECTAKRTNIPPLSQYFEMTVEDIFVDCSPCSLLILFRFSTVERWIEMLCCEDAEMSGLCGSDSAQTLQKETCTRTVGRAIPRPQSAAAAAQESHWTLSLCQLHVLWQHIKEEPGSLACEPCFVYPLPARNRT